MHVKYAQFRPCLCTHRHAANSHTSPTNDGEFFSAYKGENIEDAWDPDPVFPPTDFKIRIQAFQDW